MPSGSELAAAARRISERIGELAPDVVYAPWVGEHHVDHHVLARATRLALELSRFRGEAWGYEVWTPLVPTLIVDITRVHERKQAALLEHTSQLDYRDLAHKGLALGAQRAMYLTSAARYGEGFAPLGPPSPEDRALLG
jgi:LmbE family N-acetylglucosaminyl deacetylase